MRLVWTKSALADLEAIRAYIARDSEYYAARFADGVLRTVRALRRFPELGQVVPEFSERIIRERLFHNYRIFYEIQEKRVVVLAVIHAARDLGSLTLNLPR
jgi:toxin ParE1/3/4